MISRLISGAEERVRPSFLRPCASIDRRQPKGPADNDLFRAWNLGVLVQHMAKQFLVVGSVGSNNDPVEIVPFRDDYRAHLPGFGSTLCGLGDQGLLRGSFFDRGVYDRSFLYRSFRHSNLYARRNFDAASGLRGSRCRCFRGGCERRFYPCRRNRWRHRDDFFGSRGIDTHFCHGSAFEASRRGVSRPRS